jgi:hypothetical protein
MSLTPVVELNSLTPDCAAKLIDQQVDEIFDYQKRSYVQLGLLCKEMRDRELWEHLGYDSFNAWMSKGGNERQPGA